jgi:hypothetical protein
LDKNKLKQNAECSAQELMKCVLGLNIPLRIPYTSLQETRVSSVLFPKVSSTLECEHFMEVYGMHAL